MKNGFKPRGKHSLISVERQKMVLSDVERFLLAYERNRQIIERVLFQFFYKHFSLGHPYVYFG
jgi:hypothetical protein